jgi:hypothetical protein
MTGSYSRGDRALVRRQSFSGQNTIWNLLLHVSVPLSALSSLTTSLSLSLPCSRSQENSPFSVVEFEELGDLSNQDASVPKASTALNTGVAQAEIPLL